MAGKRSPRLRRRSSPKGSSGKSAARRFVLITGFSGSGKGSVLKVFEDLGYYCVDNLPIDLIPKFAELCSGARSRFQRAAVVVDIRGGEALSRLPAMVEALARADLKPTLVFLEASDRALIRRFEETRRPHPLGRDLPVREGVRLERLLLKPMRELADVVIDTTRMTVHELRETVLARFGGARTRHALLVSVISFGFRHGVPADADLVFDVRFLPNPNYVSRLKPKTGRDPAVRRFVESYPQTREFFSRLKDLLLYLLPHYIREGKSYLTIAIGCTGGRHRSVAIAEQLAAALLREGFKTKILHRDIGKETV